MRPKHRRQLSVAKQSSFRERKDARLHSRLLDDNTVFSCHFPMALSDIKTTESGKHDWLLLYFLILPIISNSQTHNDHQHRIQKLRSDNQISLPKGQTVYLIQFNLVKGQSSFLQLRRFPLPSFSWVTENKEQICIIAPEL